MDDHVTLLLQAVDSEDSETAQRLLPKVYEELRRLAAAKMARESPDQTLQPTALVHEAYLRLLGDDSQKWDSRGHYFAAAAEAMRRILIERARAKCRLKRGGANQKRINLEDISLAVETKPDALLAIDEAMEEFAREDPTKAELVKLRYYAGMTIPEAAAAMEISEMTAKRYWKFARAWLFQQLSI